MVYPPQHYQNVTETRSRGGRDRIFVIGGGIVAAVLIALTLFSLTSTDGQSGHGCLNFTYTMAMGGEQFHECGHKAKATCASPPDLGGLANGLLDRLPAECRKAGLPYEPGKTGH